MGVIRWATTAASSSLQVVARRKASGYVDRVRLLDYLQLHDNALINEFTRGYFVLMVDRKPLVTKGEGCVRLISTPYQELKKKLGDYGFAVELPNSCLLDALSGEEVGDKTNDFVTLFGTAVRSVEVPEDSPVSVDSVRDELGKTLNGSFIDVRMAMLTLETERERNHLARFQALTRWSRVYKRCPKCANVLRQRVSKSGAECVQCRRIYYPTFSPVAICLITDPTDEHCLLVRHRGSVHGVYTAVAGFAQTGESLVETAKREIAEEVGLECKSVRALQFTQPWPMPDSSLMCAFVATALKEDEVKICPDELECARWFSRTEVEKALKKTLEDPFLQTITRELDKRQVLSHIPPHGAIAHRIIRSWVERRL